MISRILPLSFKIAQVTALLYPGIMGQPYVRLDIENANDDSKHVPLIEKFGVDGKTEETEDDMQKYPFTAFRDITIHFIFLIIVCVIVFSSRSSSYYYLNSVMSNLFTLKKAPSGRDFSKIRRVEDIWEYMENQLMSGLYSDSITSSDIKTATILNENLLFGLPRIRMLKVKNDSCDVVDRFATKIKQCYSYYDNVWEDRTDFTPVGYANLSAFAYTTAKDLGNKDLWGYVSTYGDGGFVQYLSTTNKNTSIADIAFLKAISPYRTTLTVPFRQIDGLIGERDLSSSISPYTMAISICSASSSYAYLPSFLSSFIILIFELPPVGGLIPMSEFTTLRLLRYVSKFDYVVLVFEVLFIFFTAFFIVQGVFAFRKYRLDYFNELRNVYDFVRIWSSIFYIIFSIHRTIIARSRIEKLLDGSFSSSPFPMDDVVNREIAYRMIASMLIFASWWRIVMYIDFNEKGPPNEDIFDHTYPIMIKITIIFISIIPYASVWIFYGNVFFGNVAFTLIHYSTFPSLSQG